MKHCQWSDSTCGNVSGRAHAEGPCAYTLRNNQHPTLSNNAIHSSIQVHNALQCLQHVQRKASCRAVGRRPGKHLSWPAASRLTSECAAMIQNRSCSRLNVCTPVRLDMSHTRMLLSSELDTMISWHNIETDQPLQRWLLFPCRRRKT